MPAGRLGHLTAPSAEVGQHPWLGLLTLQRRGWAAPPAGGHLEVVRYLADAHSRCQLVEVIIGQNPLGVGLVVRRRQLPYTGLYQSGLVVVLPWLITCRMIMLSDKNKLHLTCMRRFT